MTNFIGTLLITAYISTGHPCMDGKWPINGETCAAPRWIPIGTKIFIEGVGVRTAHDRCGKNHIDLFTNSLSGAMQWGVKRRRVWIIETSKTK